MCYLFIRFSSYDTPVIKYDSSGTLSLTGYDLKKSEDCDGESNVKVAEEKFV